MPVERDNARLHSRLSGHNHFLFTAKIKEITDVLAMLGVVNNASIYYRHAIRFCKKERKEEQQPC